MRAPINTAPESLPWYKSKVIVGTLIALVSFLASKFGLPTLAAPDQAQLVDLILTLVGAGGAGTALYGRLTQKHAPPITVTDSTTKAFAMLVLVPFFLLASCALNTAPPGPITDLKYEGITSGAVAAEIAARTRCPRNALELAVLFSARTTFDIGIGLGLPETYQRRIAEARDETNKACGILAAAPQ